jgi:hypothetical protein
LLLKLLLLSCNFEEVYEYVFVVDPAGICELSDVLRLIGGRG